MAATSKEFKLSHIFKDVSKLGIDERLNSPNEEYFSVPWMMTIYRMKEHLGVYLFCDKPIDDNVPWTINVEYNFKLANSSGKCTTNSDNHTFEKRAGRGWGEFINWDTMIKDYLINDSITIEATVQIKNMTGASKNVLRFFDKSTEEYSDVVIDVKGTKFYVLRKLLASHSSFFKTLLLGAPMKSEVSLTDINAADFQTLLEVLYGEYSINDNTVGGVLQLAVKYNMPFAIHKCIEFLSEKSAKPMRDLLQIANQYELVNLKTACISKITTMDGIRGAMAINPSEMDPTVLVELLKKAVAIQ